jgi:hypothetical protein
MGQLGVQRLHLGKVLNHSDQSVTAIYDRYEYAKEKRVAWEAWEAWEAELLAIAAGKDKDSNVVPLRRTEG